MDRVKMHNELEISRWLDGALAEEFVRGFREPVDQDKQDGRCDTCGAPCDRAGCLVDRDHCLDPT